jgi:drug/metabolite transporter (DMT)-like permease
MADALNTAATGPGYGRGLVMVFAAGVIFSVMGIGVRSMQEAEAFQILFYRSIGGAIGLWGYLMISNRAGPLRAFGPVGLPAVIGGLCLMVAFAGSIVSLVTTTVANAVFLLATAPLWSAIIAFLVLGERVRLSTLLTILIGGVGVAIMVIDGISAGHIIGNVAALACALAFALFAVVLRRERNIDTMPVTCLGGVFAVFCSATAVYASGQSLIVPMHDAVLAVGLGLFVVAGGLVTFTRGARTVPAAEATLLSMSEVVLAPIWVWLLLGESASLNTLTGGAILLSALIGNALSGLVRQRREALAERNPLRPAHTMVRARSPVPPRNPTRPPAPTRGPVLRPIPPPSFARR